MAIESVLYGLGALLTGMIAGVGFAYLFSRSLGVDRVAVPLTMTGAVSLVTLLCVAAVGIGFAISISRRPVTENLTAE